MEMRTLKAFVEVVRQGGFSRAAKVVFATQSTVSKAVKQLEDELGVQLLDRAHHRSEMTAAGQIVYRRAQSILTQRDDMIAELGALRGLKRGILRLGMPLLGTSVLFAPVFATFRSRYPGIDIRLVEKGSQHLEELLSAGEIDLAALLFPIAHDFEWQSVRSEPLVVLLPADHPLAGQAAVDLPSLADFPFILFEEGFALNPVVLSACAKRGFTPTIAARSGQLDFLVELVAAGLGVAFLPRMIAEPRRHPNIRHVLLAEPGTEWHIGLFWRRGGYLPPAARAWLDLAREAHPAA